MENLPVGKYYVVEAGTAYGYVLDDEPRYVDLTYRDQDTPVVVYDEDWQNNRQRAVVSVLKKEKDSDRVLEERSSDFTQKRTSCLHQEKS